MIIQKLYLVSNGLKNIVGLLNNETIITNENEIELSLSNGLNDIEVKTNKDCQGIYKETIIIHNQPLVYPNPVENNILFINLDDLNLNQVLVEMYDLGGKIVFSKTFQEITHQLKVDLSNIPSGFFILNITTSDKLFNYKIIKQ